MKPGTLADNEQHGVAGSVACKPTMFLTTSFIEVAGEASSTLAGPTVLLPVGGRKRAHRLGTVPSAPDKVWDR